MRLANGSLTKVPAISGNLMNILNILKEEEKYEAQFLVENDGIA